MAKWIVPFDGPAVPAGPCRNCGEPIVAMGVVLNAGVAEDYRWSHAVGGDRCQITFARPKYWQDALAEVEGELDERGTPVAGRVEVPTGSGT